MLVTKPSRRLVTRVAGPDAGAVDRGGARGVTPAHATGVAVAVAAAAAIETLRRHDRRGVTHCERFASIDALLEATAAASFARDHHTPERVRSSLGAIPRDVRGCT